MPYLTVVIYIIKKEICKEDLGITSINTVMLTPVARRSPMIKDTFSPESAGSTNTRDDSSARMTLGTIRVSVWNFLLLWERKQGKIINEFVKLSKSILKQSQRICN